MRKLTRRRLLVQGMRIVATGQALAAAAAGSPSNKATGKEAGTGADAGKAAAVPAAVPAASPAAASPAAPSASPAAAPAVRGSMHYRILGATGLAVSEIGFGGYPIEDPSVLEYAIDKGINYVDTSDDYREGLSEEVIGEVMRRRRREVVLATKFHPWATTKKEEMLRALDGSLRRLRTDHVDVIQVHRVGRVSGGGVERIKNPELLEAFAIAHKQGKARFLGVTGHDGDLPEIMGCAIDSGKFGTILCRYNFLDFPVEPDLFKHAKDHGVGVLVMKTLAGAKSAGVKADRRRGITFAQAALAWVLRTPQISCALISIATKDQVDEYTAASGLELGPAGQGLLDDYRNRFSAEVCRMCNACEPACPHQVPVAQVARLGMYYHEYGMHREAARLYARLPHGRDPTHCLTCAAPCESACVHGVSIKALMVRAGTAMGPRG